MISRRVALALFGAASAALTSRKGGAVTQDQPSHPWIPEWKGERSWSAPGEARSSTALFRTDNDIAPFRIEHNRDMIFDGSDLEQDYNFIDYLFGSEAHPFRARHYLGSPEVSILPPDQVPLQTTAAAAVRHLPPGVLNYCQRRFRGVSIMTRDGYAVAWGEVE